MPPLNDLKRKDNTMKKTHSLAALLTVMMIPATFCACGNSADDTPENTAPAEENTSAAEGEQPAADDAYPVFTSDGTAKVTISDTSFMVDGRELWINGVNTPWHNWNDFGSQNFDADFWESHFAELEEAGVNASRVWINCAGMHGVRLKSTGEVKEVTDKHWQDVDKLMEIAEKHHIYIMATLISFDHFKDSNTEFESWRNMITTDVGIDSFVDNYVIPFSKRYDSCDYLWSIDLCNEIDWVKENDECGKIGFENISKYFSKAAAGIHENSDILVTAGMGMIKYNSDNFDGNFVSDDFLKSLSGNDNSYLDFYSPHYYQWQKASFGYPFEQSPTSYGLDGTKPAVIGECAAIANSGWTSLEEYEGAYNNGWNGVMAWTSNGVDDCGSLDDIREALANMVEIAPEKVHPLG